MDDRGGRHKGLLGFLRLAREIRLKQFDLAIIFHTKRRYNLACYTAGIPCRLGYKNNKFGFLLTHPVKDDRALGEKHEAEYCMDVLKAIGIENDDLDIFVPLQKEAEEWMLNWMQENNLKPNEFIAIHPGASDPAKCWPTANFALLMDRLAERYPLKIVLIGSPQTMPVSDEILRQTRKASQFLNLTGKTSLAQMVSLLRRTRLLISNDSGPVHVAAGVGTSVISLFLRNQPGINAERWKPLGPEVIYWSPVLLRWMMYWNWLNKYFKKTASMKFFNLLIVFFFFSAGLAFAKSGFDSHAISNQALEDLNTFRVESMISDMETAISTNPRNIGKYVPLIYLFYNNRIWDKAEKVLKLAIENCPNERNIDLNGWLADDLLNQKKWDEAKGYLDKAVKEFPDEAMLYYDLAVYYFYKGDYVSAGSLMKTIALKDKDTKDTYYALYDHLLVKEKEDHPGLIQMAQAALDAEPENFKTHRLYAVVLRNAHLNDFDKQLSEILDHLNTALKLNPKYILTYITFADTYLLLGNNQNNPKHYKTAIEWLDKAKKLHDRVYENLDYDYANIYLQMSQYEKAINYAQKYHKMNPGDPTGKEILGDAYNNFAYDCYEKGIKLRQGIGLIDKALKLDPDNGIYLSTKAELLYKLKEYEQAYTLIIKARNKLPKEEEINKDMAMIEKALKLDKR